MVDQAPLTEGERWSRELLAELRAEGYRPRAWIDLLARSQERATATRRDRPELARQARRWGIVGALATAAAARASGRRVGHCLAWWGLCWAMLEWHLGMVDGPGGEHRARLSPADALTLARVGLVPHVGAPVDRRAWTALVAVGAATDAADGWLARRHGPTRLGRDLDSGADAAFFTAATWGAARAGWLGRPVALVSLARYLGGVAFVAHGWFASAGRPQLALDSTRWAALPSAGALVLAGAGARRAGGALLLLTSAAALATRGVAAFRRQA